MDQDLTDEQVMAPKEPTGSNFSDPNKEYTDEEVSTPVPQQINNKIKATSSVAHAFNQGYHESTQGFEDLGLSQEAQDAVRKSKIYEGSGPVGQAVWDQIVTPAATALDATMRVGMAAFTGTGAALQKYGENTTGSPQPSASQMLHHPIGAAAGMAGELLASVPEGGLMGAEVPSAEVPKFTTQDLLKAKSVGALDSDAVYFGTKEPTPEQEKAMTAAADATANDQMVSEGGPVGTPPKHIDDQLSDIKADMKQKIMAAGRPEEEADAVSQLESARYQTLAEQYPKYSAEEWYNRESADIKAGQGVTKARELAQPYDATESLATKANDAEQDNIRANLSANTESIPGIKRLNEQAEAGDENASHLLNHIADDNLQRLVGKIPGASVETTPGHGLFEGYQEPSLNAKINFNAENKDQVLAALAKFADNFNQKQIHVRQEVSDEIGTRYDDGSYATPVYSIDIKQPLTRAQVQKVIDESGLKGLTYNDKQLEAYYVGHPEDANAIREFQSAIDRAKESLGDNDAGTHLSSQRLWAYGEGEGATAGYDAIRGELPETKDTSEAPTVQRVAEHQTGKSVEPQAQREISPQQARLQSRIAEQYEHLPDNDLKNPLVDKAYTELANEIEQQYNHLPIKVEAWADKKNGEWVGRKGEPYKNSEAMRKDVLDNNHMYFFTTNKDTFGPEGSDFTGHPLLKDTDIKSDNGYPMKANDLLRVVHDYYAHLLSPVGFGPKGEEAAWRNHIATMDNPWARWALTSETRGQNSWVNFGSHVDQASPLRDRPFARQKAALLPLEDSLTGDQKLDAPIKELQSQLSTTQRQGSLANQLYRPLELEQKARGKIKLATDTNKATITLMKNADASTLIHEKGHEWTDQLLRLSGEEDAPQRMKDDAATLRKFGDADEAGNIPTRGHEKIARAFEKYIKSGFAPSKQLRGVFDKFAQWMGKIYQAVKGMNEPISADIREVFDRMLASNPERQWPGKAMADIHEADAKTTPPERAGQVADTIREEVKSTAQQHDREVHDALTTAEKTSGEPSHATGAPEPATEPARQEPPEVADGGTKSEAKGSDLRGETGERSGDAARESKSDPAKPIPPGESKFVDKAGNIRLENLTDNEDVRSAMRQMAAENNQFMAARGGVVSDAEVSRLADAMGIPERELNIQKLRAISLNDGIPLAVRIKVGRQMLVQSATAAKKAMVDAANGGEEELMALAEARRKHLMIQETISSITAEWGRAGRAFQDISRDEAKGAQDITELFQSMTGMTMKQMQDMAKKGASLDTPQQLSKFLNDSKKPSFGDMLLEMWINGKISGPATHTTYTVGNTLLALWRGIPETAVAAGLSKLRGKGIPESAIDSSMEGIKNILGDNGINAEEAAGKIKEIKASLTHPALTQEIKDAVSQIVDESLGEKSTPKADFKGILSKIEAAFGTAHSGVRFGEVPARVKGAIKAIPTSIEAAGKALKTGVTTLLPGETSADMPFQRGGAFVKAGEITNTDISWKELGADTFGAIKGMRDAFIGIGDLIKAGGVEGEKTFGIKRTPVGAIPDFTIKGVNALPLGTVIRAPGRVIAAIHSFFRTMNYSIEKSAGAYRIAADEGLTGHDFSARVADKIVNPSVNEMAGYKSEATELTLMGQGGRFTQMLSRLTNAEFNLPGLGQTKLLKFIDPFVKISSNIIEQAIIERSPLGLLSSEVRADLSGINGATARDFASARMLVGTALMTTVGGLTAEGFVNGSGPSDPKEASAWRMLGGNMPHSVRIGETWYDIHRLGPLGQLVSVASDLYEMGDKIAEGDATKVASMLMHAVTENLMEESWLRGPAELIKAITDHDRYGDSYVRNMAASFLPYDILLSQSARAIDPYSRQIKSVMDAIKAKIPYVSEGLTPRRDIWGEPVPNKGVLGIPGFSAIYEMQVNTDPVNQRLLALGMWPGQPKKEINGVKLTDKQYDDYCTLSGQLAKTRLDHMIANRNFASMPEGIQMEMINKTIEAARQQISSSVIKMRNPDIIKKAMANKLSKAITGKVAQ